MSRAAFASRIFARDGAYQWHTLLPQASGFLHVNNLSQSDVRGCSVDTRESPVRVRTGVSGVSAPPVAGCDPDVSVAVDADIALAAAETSGSHRVSGSGDIWVAAVVLVVDVTDRTPTRHTSSSSLSSSSSPSSSTCRTSGATVSAAAPVVATELSVRAVGDAAGCAAFASIWPNTRYRD